MSQTAQITHVLIRISMTTRCVDRAAPIARQPHSWSGLPGSQQNFFFAGEMPRKTFIEAFKSNETNQQANTPWANAFAKGPIKLLSHTLPQAEALSFSADNKGFIYTSEYSSAPLWFAELPQETTVSY